MKGGETEGSFLEIALGDALMAATFFLIILKGVSILNVPDCEKNVSDTDTESLAQIKNVPHAVINIETEKS
jgi:hypothetical protein